MKIYKGIVKKVPSDEQFENHANGEMEISKLSLLDTVRTIETDEGSFESLPIRLSYQDQDQNGNEKYTYDVESNVYVKSYKQTPILYAQGKEMRILIELDEYCPVKVVVREAVKDEKTFYIIVCVQNQHMGLEAF